MTRFNLSEWAVNNKAIVVFLMLLCAIAGVGAYERLSRQRCRSNGIRALDGANARAGGERQHERPGQGAIRRKFVLKARQLLQREFQRGKLIHVAVHRRDNVDKAQCREGSALPADREHQAGHDDGGGAVRTTASDRRAGATPLRWDLATERRVVAGDHEEKLVVCSFPCEGAR